MYVPGGKAFYPSSVLMNIAPARVAGVKEIIMVSPPSYKGGIHPVVLAAARIPGPRASSASAARRPLRRSLMARRPSPSKRLPRITGPGNTFVTAAKALVRGVVEIDSEAGPSEVVVLADNSANQCGGGTARPGEHDEEAMAVLITPSARLIEAVKKRLEEETARLPRKTIIEQLLFAPAAC